MIDFDALVLGPVMATFARPLVVTPKVSQPGAAPYQAQGVWNSTNASAMLEDGGMLSTTTLSIGIRNSDFAVVPAQGDWITLDTDIRAALDVIVDDTNPDGEGGTKLIVKRSV